MSEFISSWMGTAFCLALVFAGGAWVGRPMFAWLSGKMPWSK